MMKEKKIMKRENLKKILISILIFVSSYVLLFIAGYLVSGSEVWNANKYLLGVSFFIWFAARIGLTLPDIESEEMQKEKKGSQNKFEKFLKYWRNFCFFSILFLLLVAICTSDKTAIVVNSVILFESLFSFVAISILVIVEGFVCYVKKPTISPSYCISIAIQHLAFFIVCFFIWLIMMGPLF